MLRITRNSWIDLRMCSTLMSVLILALLPQRHSPQAISPTLSYIKVTRFFVDGDEEDLMTVENAQLGQAPNSPVPEGYLPHTARRDPGAVRRVAQRRRAHVEVPVPPRFLAILKTSFVESRITGVIKITMPAITSRNKSRMLFNDINGQLMNKSTQQLLLLRAAQQRMLLPDSDQGTGSSATHTGSRGYDRDDTERCSQCR